MMWVNKNVEQKKRSITQWKYLFSFSWMTLKVEKQKKKSKKSAKKSLFNFVVAKVESLEGVSAKISHRTNFYVTSDEWWMNPAALEIILLRVILPLQSYFSSRRIFLPEHHFDERGINISICFNYSHPRELFLLPNSIFSRTYHGISRLLNHNFIYFDFFPTSYFRRLQSNSLNYSKFKEISTLMVNLLENSSFIRTK